MPVKIFLAICFFFDPVKQFENLSSTIMLLLKLEPTNAHNTIKVRILQHASSYSTYMFRCITVPSSGSAHLYKSVNLRFLHSVVENSSRNLECVI